MASNLFVIVTLAAAIVSSANAISVSSRAARLQRFENGGTVDPVKRVVALLNEMMATLQKEMEEDQTLHDKLICWANTNTNEKDDAVSTSTAKIAELESTIEGLTAKSGALSAKIEELENELKENKQALAEATAIREEQLKEYNAKALDSTQDLENLKAAITVLSKHHPDTAFPQMPQPGFLQVDSDGWAAADIEAVKLALKSASSFVQARGGEAYQPDYAPQSGEIMGIMKQLLEEMQGDHEEAAKVEMQRATSFQQLRSAKESEIGNAEAMAEQKEDELATSKNDLAEAKENHEQETDALNEAQKFLKKLKETRENAEKDFDERKKTRLEEIQAVTETIAILTTDEARDNQTAVYSEAESFIQLRAVRRRKEGASAGQMRRAAAAKLRSQKLPELAMLATQVELDSFAKVKAAIDKMVKELEQQQKDEVKKNDYCKETIQENEMDTAKNKNLKTDLEAKIGSLESKIKALEEGIANAEKARAEARVNLQRATENRKVDNIEYQKTVADQVAVIEVLHKALDRLAKFYDQQSLLQRSATDPSAPPVAQKEYAPNKASGGVMSMIEKLIGEAQTMVADAKKGESEAQSSYEAIVADTNSAVDGYSKQILTKKGEKADTHEEKLQTQSDLGDTEKELKALAQYNAELHAECDEVLRNFDVRQEARQQEVEALKQAKQILSGASMS